MSDLEQRAIKQFQLGAEMALAYYGKPIVVTISGGKDSDVLLEIAKRSGSSFSVVHNLTTADAPQTVRHVKEQFWVLEEQGIFCVLSKPKMSIWQLIPEKKMPPTRIARYCCSVLKENTENTKNCMIATGVRWAESSQRKRRAEFETIGGSKKTAIRLSMEELLEEEQEQMQLKEVMLLNDNGKKRKFIERCEMKGKSVCNPIIDWKDSDIWQFIKGEGIPYNPLYDMGFHRVGCIGCPMAGRKERELQFELFPTYKRAYILAFEKMLAVRKEKGLKITELWENGESVFRWWMEYEEDERQMKLEGVV